MVASYSCGHRHLSAGAGFCSKGLPVPDLDVMKQAELAMPRAGAGISPPAGPTIPLAGARVGSGDNQCGSLAADSLQVQQTVCFDLYEKLYLAAAAASVGGSLV